MGMGFNPKQKLQNDINDFNKLVNDDTSTVNPPKANPNQMQNRQSSEEDEDLGFKSKKPKKDRQPGKSKLNKIVGIFIIIAVIILIVIIAVITLPGKSEADANRGSAIEQSSEPSPSESSNTTKQEPTATFEDDDSINPGISDTTQDVEGSSPNQNLSDAGGFTQSVTDLNGNELSENYVVSSREIVTDYVNYEKKRGVTSEGLELYWLDVVYKDKPYVIQVPYQTWVNLDLKGTTVVDAEVLNIDDGSQIISYMQLKGDINEIINRAEQADEEGNN